MDDAEDRGKRTGRSEIGRNADGPLGPAVRDDPADGALQVFARCSSLLREGRHEASALLERCTTEHPGHARGWALLGDTLAELGRQEAALVCYDRARRTAPTAEIALRVGTALRAMGRLRLARTAFAEAAARDPTSVRARFLLGVAAQDAGDPAGAAAAYEAALALDPRLGEAALNLGTARQALGDVAGARRAYGRAARLRPDGFARAAQALTSESVGELWLDLGALRQALGDA